MAASRLTSFAIAASRSTVFQLREVARTDSAFSNALLVNLVRANPLGQCR
jgi:hypothetical protein